jgi:hypothetical protein
MSNIASRSGRMGYSRGSIGRDARQIGEQSMQVKVIELRNEDAVIKTYTTFRENFIYHVASIWDFSP